MMLVYWELLLCALNNNIQICLDLDIYKKWLPHQVIIFFADPILNLDYLHAKAVKKQSKLHFSNK
jgi:hypothetical protein